MPKGLSDYEKHGKPSWRMLVKAVMDIDGDIATVIANGHKGSCTLSLDS